MKLAGFGGQLSLPGFPPHLKVPQNSDPAFFHSDGGKKEALLVASRGGRSAKRMRRSGGLAWPKCVWRNCRGHPTVKFHGPPSIIFFVGCVSPSPRFFFPSLLHYRFTFR